MDMLPLPMLLVGSGLCLWHGGHGDATEYNAGMYGTGPDFFWATFLGFLRVTLALETVNRHWICPLTQDWDSCTFGQQRHYIFFFKVQGI